MNELLLKLLGRVYMNEADDGTGGGAGGGAADRGDNLPPAEDDVDPKLGAAATDEDPDGKGGDPDDKGNDPDNDGQPRDKDGKFKPKEPAIPKARFDEVRTKAKERETALLNRIAELEKQTAKEVQVQDAVKLEKEVEALEDEYQKLLDDGKLDRAKEVMRQIRLKERQIVTAEAEHKSERARVQAVEQLKFDMLVEKIESEFPALNPDSDQFDEAVVEEVVLLRTGFERAGLSSTAALTKAVKYVLGDAKKPEPVEDRKGIAGGKKPDARRQDQLAKNIDAAKKQPAKIGDVGVDSNKKGGGLDTANIRDMTEEEFNALPAATKARLRGDVVEDVAA